MLQTIAGLFLVAHGLVHILYVAQSGRPGGVLPSLDWPGDSWAFSRRLGVKATGRLAALACLFATVAFVAAGVLVLLRLHWWQPLGAGAAAFSAAVFVLFWDGTRTRMRDQGWLGVLIDVAILAVALALG